MNLYKKIIPVFAIGLFLVPSIHGQVTQLDDIGKKIGLELIKVYIDFARTIKAPPLKFNFEQWNSLLHIYIKNYVEDNSTMFGKQDEELIRNLNLLLAMSYMLTVTIRKAQNFTKPIHPLNEDDLHLLSRNLLFPFKHIEQTTKNIIIPTLDKQSYWISAKNKNKAKAMLILTFNLMQHIAADTMAYVNYHIKN